MICPNCLRDAPSDVLETRPFKGLIKRYRKCSHCGRTYPTVEYVTLKQKPGNPLLNVVPVVRDDEPT